MKEHEDDSIPGLRGLPMDQPPARDLWPGISARISVRRHRWNRTFLAAAACTVLALTAVLSLRVSEGPLTQPQTFAGASATAEWSSARRVTDLRANRALIKANLRLTQSAEGDLRKALRQSPGDESLRSLLSSTQDQRHELHQLLLADQS